MTRKEKMLELNQGYNIMVTGRHVQITEPMKDYAIEKISKLERIGTRIIDVTVVMDIQKLQHKVDITMKYGRHTIIKSSAATTDMYISVDQAVDKLKTQLKKYLGALHDHHAKGHAVTEMAETVYEAPWGEEVEVDEVDLDEVNTEIEAESARRVAKALQLPRIVRKETQPLKILTVEEAIMKMDLSQAPVILFKGEEDQKLKVLYRRADGNLGVIEPE